MNEPAKRTLLLRAELDENDYLRSLLAAALQKELIDGAVLERIQLALMQQTAAAARRYTMGDSSSVRVEIASELLQGVVFTVDAALKSVTEPDDALKKLLDCGVARLYDEGQKLLVRQVKTTKLFYASMRGQWLMTDNDMYRETMHAGIRGFFKRYDVTTFPEKRHITADYPVLFYPEKEQGITFIRTYLQCVQYENRFCRAFSPLAVTRALTWYALSYGETVHDMVENLYEVVLSSAVLCAVAGEDIGALFVSREKRAMAAETIREPAFLLASPMERVLSYIERDDCADYVKRTCIHYGDDIKRILLLLCMDD